MRNGGHPGFLSCRTTLHQAGKLSRAFLTISSALMCCIPRMLTVVFCRPEVWITKRLQLIDCCFVKRGYPRTSEKSSDFTRDSVYANDIASRLRGDGAIASNSGHSSAHILVKSCFIERDEFWVRREREVGPSSKQPLCWRGSRNWGTYSALIYYMYAQVLLEGDDTNKKKGL